MVTLLDLLGAARDLLGPTDDRADNPEYQRALVELIATVAGADSDAGREIIRAALELEAEDADYCQREDRVTRWSGETCRSCGRVWGEPE